MRPGARALLLLLALLTACVVVEEGPDPEASTRWSGPPPGAQEVRQAAAWFNDALARRFRAGWPAHLARSRDFPELPLVELTPVEDRAGHGISTRALTRALEKSLREHKSLRFLADEKAVPAFLREGTAQQPRTKPPRAGLRLRAWLGKDGRFYIELEDRVRKATVVTVRSQQAGGF